MTELEEKYPDFNGLNLTWETREGLAKHYTQYDKPTHLEEFDFKSSSLEAQIANLADEVTYYSHDLDDGLGAGLITVEQLQEVGIWQTTFGRVSHEHPGMDRERQCAFTIRELIEREVSDVITTSDANIAVAKVNSADEVRELSKPLISYSKELRKANQQLRDFLYKNLFFNPVAQTSRTRRRRHGGTFPGLRRQPASDGRKHPAPPRKGRPLPRHLRLHRRHDRPLCAGGVQAELSVTHVIRCRINPNSFKLTKSWLRLVVRWPRMMWSRTEMLSSSPALTRRLVTVTSSRWASDRRWDDCARGSSTRRRRRWRP